MKILLIIFVISTIALSGCGVLNLSDFVLPDDIQFINVIKELNTPREICQYMLDNFTYKKTTFYNLTPYELWLFQEGDCNDFRTFACFIARYHNYETYYILIYFKDTSEYHILAVFLESGRYTYSNNRFYHPLFASSFNEIVLDFFTYDNKEFKSYEVYDYNMNLIEQETNN